MPRRRPLLRLLSSTLQVLGLTLLLGWGAPWAAHAAAPTDPTARAEWLSGQAEQAFANDRFEEAISLYLQAWEAAPTATLLYNVAFIYDRRLNDAAQAVLYYDRVAAAREADPGLIAKAKARALTLREASRASPPVTPSHPPVGPHAPPPTPASSGPGLGSVLTTSAGAAIVVGGLIVGVFAKKTEDDFKASTTVREKLAYQWAGRIQAQVADGLMIGGAAVMVGGIVWMILDSGDAEAESTARGLRLVPQVGWGGVGLALEGGL